MITFFTAVIVITFWVCAYKWCKKHPSDKGFLD